MGGGGAGFGQRSKMPLSGFGLLFFNPFLGIGAIDGMHFYYRIADPINKMSCIRHSAARSN